MESIALGSDVNGRKQGKKMNTTTLVLLILGGMVLIGTLTTGLVLIVIRQVRKLLVLADLGSLSRLAEHYGTTRMPTGETLTRQTVQIGSVLYRRCIDVAVEETGLYLRRGRNRLLIPWAEIHELQWVRLFWQATPCLVVGRPPAGRVTIPREVLRRIQREHPGLEFLPGVRSVDAATSSEPESVLHA